MEPRPTPTEQQEYLREAEEQQRRTGRPPFKSGREAMEAFAALFESDEEAAEFADLLQQMREEDRARYPD